MTSTAIPALGDLLRNARHEARPYEGEGHQSATQEWLAGLLRPATYAHAQRISQYEKGTRLPELSQLGEIYRTLRNHHPNGPVDAEFATWVASWLAAAQPSTDTGVRELLDRTARTLIGPRPPARRADAATTTVAPLRTLADFATLNDVTVIFGDRRETKSMSAADCLIYSGSITDAMHLPAVGAAIPQFRVRSDKLLVRMPRTSLELMPEIGDSHLLVIGSPAANWAARLLNEGALFPFRIEPEAVEATEKLIGDGRMQNPGFATAFWRYAQMEPADREQAERDLDEDDRDDRDALELANHVLEKTSAKSVMNDFRASGFLDPADQRVHGAFTHPANDFAVVTMARNPYSRRGHRAVLCAGIHGPGTAAAVRELLTRPETFAERPWGAVLEVGLTLGLDWPSRFEQTTVEPQTRPYSTWEVLGNLTTAHGTEPSERSPLYRYWGDRALTLARDLARELAESAPQPTDG